MISSSLMPEDKKEFVSGATCEVMKNRSELETVPGSAPGPNKAWSFLLLESGYLKKEGGHKNRKRRNERKEIEP